VTKAKPHFPPLEETWAWKSRQTRIAAEERTQALYWSTPIWMNLTRDRIKRLANNPAIARKPEERRLVKILSGEGHACIPDEKEAKNFALIQQNYFAEWKQHAADYATDYGEAQRKDDYQAEVGYAAAELRNDVYGPDKVSDDQVYFYDDDPDFDPWDQ
jgi:hypothetical protein